MRRDKGAAMSVYTFELPGPIVPKARARTTPNGSYLPEGYAVWKDNAVLTLKRQYRGDTLQCAAVTIALKGKHNRHGDADNVAGAVLDALVQAKVLVDDNMRRVPSLTISLDYCKKTQPSATVVLSSEVIA